MVRKWIRKWLGLDAVETRLDALECPAPQRRDEPVIPADIMTEWLAGMPRNKT